MSDERNEITPEHVEEDSGAHQVPTEFVRSPFQEEQTIAPEPLLDEQETPPGVAPLPPPDEADNGVLLDAGGMPIKFNRKWLLAVIPFLLVFCCCGTWFGLGLGWTVWPVEWDASEWRGAQPYNLQAEPREDYLQALADLHSFDNNDERVYDALGDTALLPDVCELVVHRMQDNRAAEAARLSALAMLMGGCNFEAQPTPAG